MSLKRLDVNHPLALPSADSGGMPAASRRVYVKLRGAREGPLLWWQARLAASAEATDVVRGAESSGQLCGVAGVSFGVREKLGHKA